MEKLSEKEILKKYGQEIFCFENFLASSFEFWYSSKINDILFCVCVCTVKNGEIPFKLVNMFNKMNLESIFRSGVVTCFSIGDVEHISKDNKENI